LWDWDPESETEPIQPPPPQLPNETDEGKRVTLTEPSQVPLQSNSHSNKWGLPGKGVNEIPNSEAKHTSRSATSLQREGVPTGESERKRPSTAQVGSRAIREVGFLSFVPHDLIEGTCCRSQGLSATEHNHGDFSSEKQQSPSQ
jgi:hypothetical protein